MDERQSGDLKAIQGKKEVRDKPGVRNGKDGIEINYNKASLFWSFHAFITGTTLQNSVLLLTQD